METQRTMTRGIDLTPELLATHGRALRGLACSLLGDAHAAEDVVQDTWLACLRHPRAIPVRLSAWLGTVTRNLALHRLRGEGRRAVRERHAAEPERLEELQQRTLERQEALRAVTQALLALEEPYKTALFLRYYEDLTPAQIAAELALPVSTVKSRLARGLERLRPRLETEFAGDEVRRTRALLALAGLPAPGLALATEAAAGTAAPAAGMLALGTKLTLAAAALACAGGTFLWWNRAQEERDPRASELVAAASVPAAAALAEVEPGPPLAGAAGERAQAGGQRESVPTAAKPGPEALHALPAEPSFPYRIRGQVRDEHDFPVPKARVFLAPHLFPLNRVAVTDAQGRFEFEFDARKPALDCFFTADDGGGRMLGLVELHLVSGTELVVDVGLNPLSNADKRIVELRAAEAVIAAKEKALAESELVLRLFEEERPEAVSALTLRLAFAERGATALDSAPECARRSDGRGIFVDPPPPLACSRRDELKLLFESELKARSAELRATGAVSRARDVEKVLRARQYELALSGAGAGEEQCEQARIHGVVRDARGNGVAGAEVRWAAPGGVFDQKVASGDDGSFTLLELATGEVVLRAGGGDHGLALERVTLAAGQDFIWNPVLERGNEVTGRISLFVPEQPLARYLVELWVVRPDSLWCDSTLTDADGRFAIPNVPPGELELHVYVSGASNPPSSLPARVVRPVFAPVDLGELVLTKDEVVVSGLAVAVLGPDGDPLPGAELRVRQSSTGRSCLAGEADEQGKLSLAGLPAGSYAIEAGGPFGWRDLGTVWIDAWAEPVELDAVRFDRPGFVQVDPVAPADLALASALWSAHPDVFGRVDARELQADGSLLLPLRPGDYVLSAAVGKDRRCESPLAVRSRQTSAFLLEASPAQEIAVRPGVPDPALAATPDARCSACHASSLAGGR